MEASSDLHVVHLKIGDVRTFRQFCKLQIYYIKKLLLVQISAVMTIISAHK